MDAPGDSVYDVVINIYRTNRLMVQPGDQQEKHLLCFLKDFSSLSSLYPHSINPDESSDAAVLTSSPCKQSVKMTPEGQPEALMPQCHLRVNPATTTELSSNKLPCPSKKAVSSDPCRQDSSASCCPLTVKLPPLKTASIKHQCLPPATSSTRSTHQNNEGSSSSNAEPVSVKSHMSSTKTKLIVNEVLCYNEHRMKRLDYDIIVKLCTGFYTENAIEQTKDVI